MLFDQSAVGAGEKPPILFSYLLSGNGNFLLEKREK